MSSHKAKENRETLAKLETDVRKLEQDQPAAKKEELLDVLTKSRML